MQRGWWLWTGRIGGMVLACGLGLGAAPGSGADVEGPDVEALLERVMRNAALEGENDRLFLQLYSFRRTRLQVERNGSGRETRRRETEWVHVPETAVSDGTADLIAALEAFRRDGEDASAVEATERAEAVGEGVWDPAKDPARGRAFEKKDFVLNAELLKRFDFEWKGREVVGDRWCWVLDFRPRSGNLPVRQFKERFINKAGGRVWVDEEDGCLARVDLRLLEPVTVVGGLVGSVKNCRYSFERERTPEGLWYTRSVDWRLVGRQVVVNKVIEYGEERLDVRRVGLDGRASMAGD